jgi:hypothetical protein
MEKKISYHAEGFLLGNLWGGGRGAYPTIKITGDSMPDIRELAEKALSDGSLDSGMGFESLIGAILNVEIITECLIEGKKFINREYDEISIGDIDEMDIEFLRECDEYS